MAVENGEEVIYVDSEGEEYDSPDQFSGSGSLRVIRGKDAELWREGRLHTIGGSSVAGTNPLFPANNANAPRDSAAANSITAVRKGEAPAGEVVLNEQNLQYNNVKPQSAQTIEANTRAKRAAEPANKSRSTVSEKGSKNDDDEGDEDSGS